MSASPATPGKKTIIGAKLTKEERAKIQERCISLKCTTSDYIKKLIGKDLAWSIEGNFARIRIEGDKLIIPCVHSGGPVPFNLADLGLRRI